jgi:hypothetical protein
MAEQQRREQQQAGEAEEQVQELKERLEVQAATYALEVEERESSRAAELQRVHAQATEALQDAALAKQAKQRAEEQQLLAQNGAARAVEAAARKATCLEETLAEATDANLAERRRDRQIERQQHAQELTKIEIEFTRAIEENEERHQEEVKVILGEQQAPLAELAILKEELARVVTGHKRAMEQATNEHAEARRKLQVASSMALASVERGAAEQAKTMVAIHEQRLKLLEESQASTTKNHGEVMLAAVRKGMADKAAQCEEQLRRKDVEHTRALEQWEGRRQTEISQALQAQGNGILGAVKQEVANAVAAKEAVHVLAMQAKEREHLAAIQGVKAKWEEQIAERERAVRASSQATLTKAFEAYEEEMKAVGRRKEAEFKKKEEAQHAKHDGALEQAVLFAYLLAALPHLTCVSTGAGCTGGRGHQEGPSTGSESGGP